MRVNTLPNERTFRTFRSLKGGDVFSYKARADAAQRYIKISYNKVFSVITNAIYTQDNPDAEVILYDAELTLREVE